MKIGIAVRALAIFAVSAAWFALFIPWNGFADPDAFYHAKASWLVWQHGPIMAAPWLDLTLLGEHFADLHFFFHVIVAPFTAVFGMFNGLRFATVGLSALFVASFFLCVRWLRLRWPLIWAGVLLLSGGLVFRLLLGKATPLALIWFVFGLASAWKRQPWLVALAAFGFALSHGGWPYLACAIPLLWIGDALYSKLVENKPLTRSFSRSLWLESAAGFLGGCIGLLVHPNYPGIMRMAWTQIVTIGLSTPFQHVNLGNEWLPTDLPTFLSFIALFLIIALLGLAGLLFAAVRPLDHQRARFFSAMTWVLAAFVALTLKSQRNVEYLVPVFVLWCAGLWSLVDLQRFHEKSFPLSKRELRGWILPVVSVCLAAVIGKQMISTWQKMNPPRFSDSTYQATMAEITDRATTSERVFHTSWDEFPMLFAADDRLRYISGLDPTFLYVASSTLSDAVQDVTITTSSTTMDDIWTLVHDRVRARFIFVSKEHHQNFLDIVRKDTRFVQIADHPDSAAFMVAPPPGSDQNPLLTSNGTP